MSFTLAQIAAAYAEVKSGADFPAYVQALIRLGIDRYETYVADGHTDYYSGSEALASPAKYPRLSIAAQSNGAAFAADLKAHQQGRTDYATFCRDCARWGVSKWVVNMAQLTCTYYDAAGGVVLVEAVPVP